MANTMDKLRELGERIVARSQRCENTKDAIAMQEHAAELDDILRESEAQGDAGAVEALITDLVDEAYQEGKQGRPAWGQRLTDIKNDLICRLAASATPRTEPAEGREAHCATCTCVPGMTPAIRFDTSPAEREGAVREHLIRLGWTPPAGDGARVTDIMVREAKLAENAITAVADWRSRAERAEARVAELEREAAAKQARIDALMLEYCPDEMTPEQVAEWARHQRPISEQAADAIDAALAAREGGAS